MKQRLRAVLARIRVPVAWPVLLIATPAMVAVWSGWVGLSKMTGFGDVQPLPGIWDQLHLNTSITLAIGVEAYGAYAVKVALSASRPRTRGFAAVSGVISLALGAYGQMQYHLLVQERASQAPESVTRFVSVLPIVVVGLGALLYHLVQGDAEVERRAAELVAAALIEAERDAAVRIAEANAAAAEAERLTVELRVTEANIAAERERIKAEREAARKTNVRPNAAARKAARPGRTQPNEAADQDVRSDDAESADAYAAWLEREGSGDPMPNRDLAALLGVSVDAARVRANRWRQKAVAQ